VRIIGTIFLVAVSIAAFAVSASGAESGPACQDGATITLTGIIPAWDSGPAFDDDARMWGFDFDQGANERCNVAFILSKQKPPATCKPGRHVVATGKVSAGLFGSTDFIATSIACS
jgi:hypothetical protein